jgi:lipopolysaccharide heptosyltransferase I
MRLLIIKPSSLGDIVHALPTVNLIRRRHPDAHIAWLVNPEFASILQNNPLINETILFPRRELGKLPGLVRQLRRQHFNVALDLQGLLRSGLIAKLAGIPRRVGLSDSREGARHLHTEIVRVPRCHAVDRYLHAASHLQCGTAPVEFPIGITETDRVRVDELLTGLEPCPIAINPMARWETKIWGDDKFTALIQKLPASRVILTGSKTEADRIKKLSSGCRNLAGQTTLTQLAELYRRCAAVITNDSGPMHIAAAMGVPVVAIFGPTDPALVGPYGKGHAIIQAEGFRCPCQSPKCNQTPANPCMTRISVEQVMTAVKPFLA